MRKTAFVIAVTKLIAFVALELVFRIGLWSLWLDGNLPYQVVDTGVPGLIVAIYVSWLLMEPFIFGYALLVKDRGLLIEQSR